MMREHGPRLRGSIALRIALLILLAGVAVDARPAETQTNPAPVAQKVQPQLDLKALAEPLQDLNPDERMLFDHAVTLIMHKQHLEALEYLAVLTKRNPKNSAVRVLRAYVLLELGNVTGALNDASVAEASGAHAAYRCWFLAQVAYLAGDKPLCRREIKHVGNNPAYGPAAEKLAERLDHGAK